VTLLLLGGMVTTYTFTLHTDKSFKPTHISLNDLESAKRGNYIVNANVEDINEKEFTIGNGETQVQVQGRLGDKKLSDLYTKKQKIYGQIQITKIGGQYSLISIKRLEGELYITNYNQIKGQVIVNTRGLIGKFN
jgi:hypothetical protein